MFLPPKILMLALLSEEILLWPEPTPLMINQIKELQSENFDIRQNAHQNLKNAGFNALKIVKLNRNNPDPEVKIRCQRIFQEYFALAPSKHNTLPSCFSLPFGRKIKTNKGSICLPDKKEVVEKYKTLWPNYDDQQWLWFDDSVAQNTTWLICYNLLLLGTPKETVVALLDEMCEKTPTPVNLNENKTP